MGFTVFMILILLCIVLWRETGFHDFNPVMNCWFGFREGEMEVVKVIVIHTGSCYIWTGHLEDFQSQEEVMNRVGHHWLWRT